MRLARAAPTSGSIHQKASAILHGLMSNRRFVYGTEGLDGRDSEPVATGSIKETLCDTIARQLLESYDTDKVADVYRA